MQTPSLRTQLRVQTEPRKCFGSGVSLFDRAGYQSSFFPLEFVGKAFFQSGQVSQEVAAAEHRSLNPDDR